MSGEAKAELRARMKAARAALTDRAERSGRIWDRASSLPEMIAARTLLCYLDVRTEVQTRAFLPPLAERGVNVAVPYCVGDELHLFHFERPDELVVGTFGVLEPHGDLRSQTAKQIAPGRVDVAFIPGVAFDRVGNRLGYGRGYFDRLLSQLRPDALRIGLAFACQVVTEVPVEAHDEHLDGLITEDEVVRFPRHR